MASIARLLWAALAFVLVAPTPAHALDRSLLPTRVRVASPDDRPRTGLERPPTPRARWGFAPRRAETASEYVEAANPYTYALNNPVNAIDPEGTIAWVPVLVVAALAAETIADVVQAARLWVDAIVNKDPLSMSEAAIATADALSGPSVGAEAATGHNYTRGGTAFVPTPRASATRGATTSRQADGGLHRPYMRKDTRAAVEARVPRDALGRAIDPNTGAPIEGKSDFGHKPGHEFRREKAAAKAEGLTQKEFNDRMNNPDLYQLEDPSSNRSHEYEQKP